MQKPIERLERENAEMKALLDELYTLKLIKEKAGKTEYYLENQPKVWPKVKALLEKLER